MLLSGFLSVLEIVKYEGYYSSVIVGTSVMVGEAQTN